MRAPGVIVDVVTAAAGVPAAWWSAYDDACLLPRVRLPGVIAARRGAAVVGSAAGIVVYDVADVAGISAGPWEVPEQLPAGATVQSTVYRQLLSTVEGYRPADTAVLHAAFFEAEPAHHDEFNDWYDTEHVPAIVAVDGYENCRRFVAVEDSRKFLALYDVTTLQVAESETAAVATSSPWSDRIRAKIATYRERRVFLWERVEVGSAPAASPDGG